MYCVYMRYLKTGREEIVHAYYDAEDAVSKIANCYAMDKNLGYLGEYYYFMVRR